MPNAVPILAVLAAAVAVATTRAVARHGAGGMTAGMAAMMAAMGTGLSVGYAAGIGWDLASATFAGVLAGGLHGLSMGRRYGPMAALDGAGGGVMGGLMGPMLAVMLLYLPLGLLLTGVLMLGLQAAFCAGAVYLVASVAGAPVGAGWLGALGRALGAEAATTDAVRDHYAVLGVPPEATAAEVAEAFLEVSRRGASDPARLAQAREALAVLSDPVRRARYEALRQEEALCCPPKVRARVRAERQAARARPERGGAVGRLVVAVAAVAFVYALLNGGLPGSSVPAAEPAAQFAPAGAAAAPLKAAVGADGVQQVGMTLRQGRYEPRLVEVKSGVPVRLEIEAVGDPG